MVRFHGLRDGKIMVKKNEIVLVFVWKGLVFSQKSRRASSNWKKLNVIDV